MKILHCPTNVGGHPLGLCRAERSLGLDSLCVGFGSNPYVDQTDQSLPQNGGRWKNEAERVGFLLKSLAGYDVFHFNFGRSIFSYPPALGALDFWDLPLLRALGKRIVVTYQGCDARQADYSQEHFPITACREPDCYGGACGRALDQQKRRRIKRVLKNAHQVFAVNPDILHVLPGAEFMPYASVDPEEWRPAPWPKEAGLRVVHLPSDRGAKGSKYVARAVARAREANPSIHFREVRGVPHAQVPEILAGAHLVIDQVLLGWYGSLAVEAMAMARPVACYIRQEDLHFIPPDMRRDLPLLNADPESLTEVLLRAAQDPQGLREAGLRGRAYVMRWHDPKRLARRAARAYGWDESLPCAA